MAAPDGGTLGGIALIIGAIATLITSLVPFIRPIRRGRHDANHRTAEEELIIARALLEALEERDRRERELREQRHHEGGAP